MQATHGSNAYSNKWLKFQQMAQMQVLTLEVDEDPAFAMVVGGFFGVEDEVYSNWACSGTTNNIPHAILSCFQDVHLHNSSGQGRNLALTVVSCSKSLESGPTDAAS